MRNLLLFLVLLLTIGCYLFWGGPSALIMFQLRLPRIINGLYTGGVLALCGAIYQALLNNPLAEPYVLGVSSGAALGSVIMAVIGLYAFMPLGGFLGALLTMTIVWLIAGSKNDNQRLILSGIIVGMFFSALISLLMYLNQQEIAGIFQVLMGNLGRVFTRNQYRAFLWLSGLSVFIIVRLLMIANRLFVVTSGSEQARALGVDVKRLRLEVFVLCSLLTGISVAYAGVISFIGLVIPHISRKFAGGSFHRLLIHSFLLGAISLLVCDFIASHLSVMEIPVGIITAFLGSPFFIFALAKK